MTTHRLRRTTFSLALTLLLPALPAWTASAQSAVPTYTVEQFMNTTSIFGASFSPDEKSILVTSNETGVFNAFAVDVATANRTALTNSTTNTVTAIGFFPDDERILYVSDQGGNENSHIFVRELDGSVTDLTPGDKVRAVFQGWADDGSAFYYGTNTRDPRYFDIYRMPLNTMSPELMLRDTVGYQFGDISPDGKWMALGRALTTSSSDIYLRNNQTGEIVNITPHAGDISNTPVGFSKDSKRLYYLTDTNSEFRHLVMRDIASGEGIEVLNADWDIMFASLSKTGRYMVVGINNDARTELRIYETLGMKRVNLPTVPAGDITGAVFAPSERTMAFYVNGDRSPANLFTLDLESMHVRQLTSTLNPEINPAHLVDGSVVRFASYDGVEIPSLLYRPHGADQDHQVPVMLWIHGGPGGQTRLGYSAQRQYLANHGYGILAVNNRGSSGYGKTFFKMDDRRHGEADLDDLVWAKKYLATLDWVDTSKVGILGGSYGGYLTLAAVTFRPDVFAVGVDLFGISNWVRTLESIPPWWESFRKALYREMGDPATDKERLLKISPLFHADQIVKPLMVQQGVNDPRVLKRESDAIVQAVKDRGGVVEYVVFPDEGHGFRKKKNQIESLKAIGRFLDTYLKGTRPRS